MKRTFPFPMPQVYCSFKLTCLLACVIILYYLESFSALAICWKSMTKYIYCNIDYYLLFLLIDKKKQPKIF